jgi:hypothetical protein
VVHTFRFDAALHNRGLTLRGSSRWVRVNPHRLRGSLAWVFTRPRSPLVGLDRRGFDAHAADDCGAVANSFESSRQVELRLPGVQLAHFQDQCDAGHRPE